jgi:uncharacterized membrane protein
MYAYLALLFLLCVVGRNPVLSYKPSLYIGRTARQSTRSSPSSYARGGGLRSVAISTDTLLKPDSRIVVTGYNRDVLKPVAALIIQNSLLIVLMRYTMVVNTAGSRYLASTAVLFCEGIKLVLSSLFLFLEEANGSTSEFMDLVWRRDKNANLSDMMALSIPAGLYILQNNLQYLAVANLSPPVFQVLYQMKIVTTAFFSVLLLNRKLLIHQWFSITMLMVGLALTQLSQQSPIGSISGLYNPIGYAAVMLASSNPNLSQLHPKLSQLNPNSTPDMSQLHPKLQP